MKNYRIEYLKAGENTKMLTVTGCPMDLVRAVARLGNQGYEIVTVVRIVSIFA